FGEIVFRHPDTAWYNVASLEGAANNFPGNASRIIDLLAQKVAANIRAGKRTLLVARKKFVARCARCLREALARLGVQGAKVVTKRGGKPDLRAPRFLPLINYGVVGVNLFEHFDCAYCLTSYLVPEEALAGPLRDLEATRDHFPVRIETDGTPPRRTAVVELP